ncbi:MAG: hypothetical protein JO071_09065 [Deltaproteobacteria bacterium]|nr:hypothetical protein [Deltaproteobacteria bacterium]
MADSTDHVLGHETFEAISDPDLNAWFDVSTLTLFGSEIGDTCVMPFVATSSGIAYTALTLVINGHKYKSQLIYSNHYHACAGAP